MTCLPGPTAEQLESRDVLRELQAAAAVRRSARIRVADAVAEPDNADHDIGERRRALAVATARWVRSIETAAAAGYPVADIARAAGVASSSVYYRLRRGPSRDPGP